MILPVLAGAPIVVLLDIWLLLIWPFAAGLIFIVVAVMVCVKIAQLVWYIVVLWSVPGRLFRPALHIGEARLDQMARLFDYHSLYMLLLFALTLRLL